MTPWERRRYVAQEIVPRCETWGRDNWATAKLLLRTPKLRLVWRKGHPVFAGLHMARDYHAARLTVEPLPEFVHEFAARSVGWSSVQLEHGPGDIAVGGRLTTKRIAEHIEKLRFILHLPGLTADDIKLDRTCIVPKLRTVKRKKVKR